MIPRIRPVAIAVPQLSEFAALSARQVLDRLLTEPEAANRRTLLLLAVHLGPPGVPEMTERLFHPKGDPVRIDAANALYKIGGAEAFAFLHRGKGVRRSTVRKHCEELLRSVEKIP